MSLNGKLCEIADAGPLVHAMGWDEIGKACGDASRRLSALESAMRDMIAAIPGGSSCDPQAIADTQREIARRAGVDI